MSDIICIFVGRLAEEKNIKLLIEAEQKLVKENNNIKLLIVGDGPEKEELHKLTKELNIEDNVIFTGKVPWDEIEYYYNLSDVFSYL